MSQLSLRGVSRGVRWLLIVAISLGAVGACGPAATPPDEPPLPVTEAVATDAPAATAPPTSLPVASPLPATPTSTQAPTADLPALQATVEASLPPTATPTGEEPAFWGPMEVRLLELETAGTPLWAAYSVGMRGYDPDEPHFVAVYAQDGGGWQELSRVVLTMCAEYVGEDSLVQVEVEPSQVWLELQSVAGAHSGCYDLLSFDGAELHTVVTHFNSSPGAGWVADLDGDGSGEVVLDATEHYVFCYACGVRWRDAVVLRWDGEELKRVELTLLPESAPSDVLALNNRAVELTGGELWKDAQSSIAEAAMRAPVEEEIMEVIKWNKIVIDLVAAARAEQADEGGLPLLEYAFYGDYDAAVEVMRTYAIDEIWRLDSPLLAGTPAEGWEMTLGDWLSMTTNAALEVNPDLAPAYFLRGWGTFLRQPDNVQAAAAAAADVARAAELAEDELYEGSLDYLTTPTGPYRPISSEACYALGEAMMNTLQMTVTLNTALFEDYFEGLSGSGCQAVTTGTGEQFPDGSAVAMEWLDAMLEEQGYVEDMMYAAGGPTGEARGYRLDGRLCLVNVGWELSEDVYCPPDRPISACEFEPWQQLFTVTLNCAEKETP